MGRTLGHAVLSEKKTNNSNNKKNPCKSNSLNYVHIQLLLEYTLFKKSIACPYYKLENVILKKDQIAIATKTIL